MRKPNRLRVPRKAKRYVGFATPTSASRRSFDSADQLLDAAGERVGALRVVREGGDDVPAVDEDRQVAVDPREAAAVSDDQPARSLRDAESVAVAVT